jgi:hypothetical protein
MNPRESSPYELDQLLRYERPCEETGESRDGRLSLEGRIDITQSPCLIKVLFALCPFSFRFGRIEARALNCDRFN